MRFSLLLTLLLGANSCSDEATTPLEDTSFNEPKVMIDASDVRTYEELRLYLDQTYAGVEELPYAFAISTDRDTSVPIKYRLADGIEFTVPIIFTASNNRIVDPIFDLGSLPN